MQPGVNAGAQLLGVGDADAVGNCRLIHFHVGPVPIRPTRQVESLCGGDPSGCEISLQFIGLVC